MSEVDEIVGDAVPGHGKTSATIGGAVECPRRDGEGLTPPP